MFLLAQPALDTYRREEKSCSSHPIILNHNNTSNHDGIQELQNMAKHIHTIQQINKLTSTLPTASPLFEECNNEATSERDCDSTHEVYHHFLNLVLEDSSTCDYLHDSFPEITMQKLVQTCTQHSSESQSNENLVASIQSAFQSLHSRYYEKLVNKFPNHSATVITSAIERYIIEDYIYEYIFIENPQDSSADENLSEKLNLFASTIEPKHLDVMFDVKEVPWKKAVKLFRSINKSKYIYGKMECIEHSLKYLFDITNLSQMGGDTFLSLTIYLVMYSNVKNLHSTLKFLTDYAEVFYESEMTGHWGYFLTNLSIAISWWKNVNLSSKPVSHYFVSLNALQVEDLISKWNLVYGTKLLPDPDFVIVEDHFSAESPTARGLSDNAEFSDNRIAFFKLKKFNKQQNTYNSNYFNNPDSSDMPVRDEDMIHRWQPRPIIPRRANGFISNCVVSWDYVSKVSDQDEKRVRRLSTSSCPDFNTHEEEDEYDYFKKPRQRRSNSFRKLTPIFGWIHRKTSARTPRSIPSISPVTSPRLSQASASPNTSPRCVAPESPPSSSFENIKLEDYGIGHHKSHVSNK